MKKTASQILSERLFNTPLERLPYRGFVLLTSQLETSVGEGEIVMQMVDNQSSLAKLTKAFQESNRHLRLLSTSKRKGPVFIDLHVDGNPAIGWIEGGRDSLDLDHTTRFGRKQNGPRFDRQLIQVERVIIDHRLAGDLRQGNQHRSSGPKSIPASG